MLNSFFEHPVVCHCTELTKLTIIFIIDLVFYPSRNIYDFACIVYDKYREP